MSVKEERMWAGSDASFQVALEAEARIAAGEWVEVKEDESPRLLSVADGLATITIKGPLVNSDSPFLRYCGVTGYPEIREALIAAVNDDTVKQILLDIDSGGGAVSGCDDTGNLIRQVHKVKPVTAYGDTMASAAYWLGCSAGKVYSGKASLVGSIGVKATFREFSKANEMAGETVTIIRAGKYKALADPNEPLSKAAEAQIQALVDASYGVFIDHVVDMRGRSYEYTDKTMGDGQEFIGQAAADVGLTDGVTTYDAVVGGLKKKIVASLTKTKDNGSNNRFSLSGAMSDHSGEANMAKKALTEADIAALAAGVQLDVKPVEIEGAADGLQDEAPAQEKVEAAAATTAAASTATATTTAAEDNKQEDTQSQALQFMQTQVAAKDEAILAAGIKIARLEDKLVGFEASHKPLLEITVKSVRNMCLAMNAVCMVSADMDATQVLAEHVRVSELFQKKFPIGGVAAVSAEEPIAKTQVDPRRTARVNAVRFQK
jgi:signal peptide peptidase SppA